MEDDYTLDSTGSATSDSFTQDIIRYFKVYLETDMSGSLLPARHLSPVRLHGLRKQLYLDRYPQLHKNMYKNVIGGFSQESFVVSQNKYNTHVDDSFLYAFNDAVQSLSQDVVDHFVREAALLFDGRSVEHDTVEQYLHACLVDFRSLIAAELVVPLLRTAQEKSKKSADATAAPVELLTAVEAIYSILTPAIEPILNRHFDKETNTTNLTKDLSGALTDDLIKATLAAFVEEQSITDAYQDLYQLHRNNAALTTTDMLLYFCEIHIDGHSFPLFYTPLTTSHSFPSVTVNFERQLYVNIQALEFVLAEFNHIMGFDQSFTGPIEPVFTIEIRNRKEVLGWMQNTVDVIRDTFGIDAVLKLESGSAQSISQMGVTLNNRLQCMLFAPLNEPVIDEYDELLYGEHEHTPAVAAHLRSMVVEKPTRYVQEINEEWEKRSVVDKLLPTSLIPLGNEQQKAMLAITKPQCAVTLIEGGPGTGKTYFASAVVAQALQNGTTTLVLSDSQANRDEISRTVVSQLDSVRQESEFHNPILRLDLMNDEYFEDLEHQFIEKLKSFHKTYAMLESELKTAKKRKQKEAVESLTQLIQNAENVNLHEVEQTISNEAKFGGRDWIIDEPIEEINDVLPKLHQSVQYIRSSDANYLLPYIEASQQKAISEFIAIIREYERVMKNVNTRLPEFIIRYRKLLPDQKNKLQSSLSYIHSNYRQYVKILHGDLVTRELELTETTDYRGVASKQDVFNRWNDIASGAKRYVSGERSKNGNPLIAELLTYKTPPEEVVSAITNYIEQVISLKSKLFGFSGRTLVVENLTRQLKKLIPEFKIKEPEKKLDELQQMVDLVEYVIEQLAQMGLELKNWKEVLQLIEADPSRVKELQKIMTALSAPSKFEFMEKYRMYDADNLLANISLLQHANELNDVFRANPSLAKLFGIKTIGQVLAQPRAYTSRFNKLATDLDDVKQLEEHKTVIKQFIKNYPSASKRLGINFVSGSLDVVDDTFANSAPETIKDYLVFKKKEQDITAYFHEMTHDDFTHTTDELRQMATLETSHRLDERVTHFVATQSAIFTAIKKAIRTGMQLTPAQFKALQQAFPCMVTDVYSYAAILPLEKDMVDLLIVDGASHSNIAEVLPALMRAKRVLALGDERQHQAVRQPQSTALNDRFRDRMVAQLLGTLSGVPADTKNMYVERLRQMFDAKNSVLQFLRPLANCEFTFVNYFRSSSELIAVSNNHFYGDALKVLKARALPLNEIITIDTVETDADNEQNLHTNAAEVRHIIAALSDLKETGFSGSIGIITPYYEQAALLQKELDECVIHDWFAKRELKVMTFDTAYGESRDYVFYSLVSSETFDRHAYVFAHSLSQPDSLGARRINVGFSRAGERIHIVSSRPIASYKGAIGEVLNSLRATIRNTPSKPAGSTSDILSDAESLLPQYFYATKFHKKHGDKLRLVTQFSLGDYLRALDPSYRHPSYKIDFLITYGDQRIIASYDDFRDKFISKETKDAASYESADDIYLQKVLENYGYIFLRLNKFNLGSRPIETFDRMLHEAIKPNTWAADNGFVPKR